MKQLNEKFLCGIGQCVTATLAIRCSDIRLRWLEKYVKGIVFRRNTSVSKVKCMIVSEWTIRQV